MANKKESFDVFAVPRNFGEDGISFNGISRRNLMEGAILAIGSGYPMFRYLPVSLSVRVILLCFVSLPLFFVGLVGAGGESLRQFFVTVIKWLFTRRKLLYYIDTGESEPPKEKGFIRFKSLFRKKDKDAIRYKRVRKPKQKKSSGLFDRLFMARRKIDTTQKTEDELPRSRQIKNMAQAFFPVEDIRSGMIITKDKRYVKILEIHPINFLLRSADEQRDIILSFAELLRIAPVKMQFKSNANRADISQFLSRTMEEMEREENPKCREMRITSSISKASPPTTLFHDAFL